MPFNLNSPKQGLLLETVSKMDTKANSKSLSLNISFVGVFLLLGILPWSKCPLQKTSYLQVSFRKKKPWLCCREANFALPYISFKYINLKRGTSLAEFSGVMDPKTDLARRSRREDGMGNPVSLWWELWPLIRDSTGNRSNKIMEMTL